MTRYGNGKGDKEMKATAMEEMRNWIAWLRDDAIGLGENQIQVVPEYWK